MDLQQVTAVPPRPLASLAEDYGAAVLHLAWGLDRRSGLRSMLFACVELLPHELPPPLDDGPQRFALDKSGDRVLLVRHVIGTAEAALAWYLRTRRGEAAALLHGEDDEQDAAIAPDGTDLLEIALLGEEPVWPNLVCVTEGVPFTLAGSDGTRAHHLVPIAPVEPSALWPDLVSEEREAVIEWLSHRLHFSLERYPEYLGSANLVAANPVVREIDTRLHGVGPPDESVLFSFTPRYQGSLDSLRLSVSLTRPTGEQHTETMRVGSQLIDMFVAGGVDSIGFVLQDERRGTLSVRPPAWFFSTARARSAEIGMSADVSSHGESQRPLMIEELEVHLHPATQRLLQARLAAQARVSSERQLLLSGDASARVTVLSLLQSARRDVCIADTNLGALELMSHSIAAMRPGVSARVLVSIASSAEGPASPRMSALAAELRNAPFAVTARSPTPTILVRLMHEEPPWGTGTLLVVDDAAWFLSGHLKDIGAQPMMLLRLPSPAVVLESVNRAFDDASPLADWLQRNVSDTEWAAQ